MPVASHRVKHHTKSRRGNIFWHKFTILYAAISVPFAAVNIYILCARSRSAYSVAWNLLLVSTCADSIAHFGLAVCNNKSAWNHCAVVICRRQCIVASRISRLKLAWRAALSRVCPETTSCNLSAKDAVASRLISLYDASLACKCYGGTTVHSVRCKGSVMASLPM